MYVLPGLHEGDGWQVSKL